MKILLVGGPQKATNDLACALSAHGMEVQLKFLEHASIGLYANGFDLIEFNSSYQSLLDEKFDVVHIQGLQHMEALLRVAGAPQDYTKLSAELRQKGSKIVLSLGLEDEFGCDLDLHSLKSNFDFICLASSSWSYVAETGLPFTTIIQGIDLGKIEAIKPEAPKPGELKLLHINQQDAAGSDELFATIAQLRQDKLRFDFTSVCANEIQSCQQLNALIKNCHIYISRLNQPYDLACIYALAHSKAVVARIPSNQHGLFSQLQLSAVLDTPPEKLHRRLSSIIREPLCLRDFSKRSRAYAEKFHSLDVYSGQLANLYNSLTGRRTSSYQAAAVF